MNFSEIFIKKPIMTVLVMVAFLIFGAFAYLNLPISDLPVVDFPIMTITVVYPGASPSTMASTIASPIENECMQIPGLESVISDNKEGISTLTLTFDLDRKIDLAAPDVQAAITRAQANLPSDLPAPPIYSKTNPTNTPILYLTITSDVLMPGELYDIGNRTIGKRISMIEGVSQVEIWGAKSAIRIQVDPNRLASLNIGIDEIAQVLKQGTVTIPGGSLEGRDKAFSVEPEGQLTNANDYEELIVAYRDNAPIRLKDVARCIDSLDNDVVNVDYGRAGDKIRSGTVVVAVSRAGGSNTVALAKKINGSLEDLKKGLPGSVNLEVFYDASGAIIESVNDVKNTIIIAFLLVILVIFLFLGRVSDTVIPGAALPLSIIGTFGIMFTAGFSLDTLSLMGLTLAVGFVVDDAIVVLENTVRHVEMGENPLTAAIKSSKEIIGTIISMTLSLLAVFIPLVFMGGVVGRIFKEFSLTVMFAIICSGVVSLTLTPMMCARMLKESKDNVKTRLQGFTDRFIGGIKDKYAVLLEWILNKRFVAIVIWVVCLVGTVLLFNILPKTFIPEGDSGAVYGQMVGPLGISAEKMHKFQDQVNNALISNDNVDQIISVTGTNPGADQSTGPFFAVLKPREKRQPMPEVVQELRGKMNQFDAGQVFVMALPALKLSSGADSTASGSKYSYLMTGEDREKLYAAADALEAKLNALPDFTDIQNSVKINMPRVEIKISRDRASMLGINANDIEYALSLAYGGGKVTTYKTDVDQYDVILELEKEYQSGPEDLSRVYVHSPVKNTLIPLDSLVVVKKTVGPQDVPHANQLNSATVSFSVKSGVPLSKATSILNKTAQDILPPGVIGALQGEAQEFESAVKSFGILILVAIGVLYLILGILYESYIHPLTILTTLPIAAFGGVATLFLFRSELSLYAYVGMFMLLGIVTKNGIMMVDFANQNLEKKGVSAKEAIYDACLVRFRPIIMTGVAAIMGAMPIALGIGADGASRRPMGLIVAGGLLFSQIITLFVTPAIFIYMQEFQEKYLDRFEMLRSGSNIKK